MSQGPTDWSSSILGAGTVYRRGVDVRDANVTAAKALADTVRSTLGPNGMDKMLVDDAGTVVITNDGGSILDRMDIDHPAAVSLVQAARSQADRIGDGTTTTVLLAGELLAAAEELLDDGLHPTTITAGYRLALDTALDEVAARSIEVDPADEDRLRDVAATAVTGKWTEDEARTLVRLAVDAALSVTADGAVERRRITRRTVPGASYAESELVEGLVIDMDVSSTTLASLDVALPRRLEDAGVALVDDQLTVQTAGALSNVTIDSPAQREDLLAYETDRYEAQANGIAAADADVVFCQKSIDDGARSRLAERGIIAVERTRQDELYKLARATGAEPVETVDELTGERVGRAGFVERRSAGGTELTVVGDCPGSRQVSLVLRGGTAHVLEETKRLVETCLDVVTLAIEERTVVPGGGTCEAAVARRLRDSADSVAGREQLAVASFADALEAIPRTLAASAGLDSIDALIDLRSRHHRGDASVGIDVTGGDLADMVAQGVLEPAASKRQALIGATDAACLLLGIDDVVAAVTDTEQAHDHEHDHEHAPDGLEATEGMPWAVGH